MLDAADTTSLALLYHLNSEPILSDAGADETVYDNAVKENSGEESVVLPQPGEPGGLLELIRRRESCRRFAPVPLALADLANLLAGTYGISRAVTVADGLEANARSVPSAGGLYPLEVYLVLQQVEGVTDGLYRYNALDHALESMKPFDRHALARALYAAPFLDHANAVVLMTAVFDRTLHKYGARGYRFILFEAGHAAQNLCLLATEAGLTSLCVGGFGDAAINRLLGLEPHTEATVYCVGIGYEP